MNTSVKAVLYTSKTLKNGEHPVLLRLTRDRKQVKISLGISCLKSDWDEKSNRPKKKHPLYYEIKQALDKAEQKAEKVILDFENADRAYTLEEVRTKLAKAQNRVMVFAYFEEQVARLKTSGRIKYADVFHATKKSLMAFRGSEDFGFSEVNPAFLNRWEEYHMAKGTKPNAFYVYLRTFKTLIGYARRDEVVAENFDPYKGISFARFRRIKTQPRALTKEELMRLLALEVNPGSKLAEAKDFFFFSYYCWGMNFVDMAYLKWTDIRDGVITYTRRKTDDHFCIDVLEPAEWILAYFREVAESEESPYVFPILSPFHQTEQQRDDRVKKVLKRVNLKLKEIGRLAGVGIPLTTYVARHTFATMMKREGVSTTLISAMMGHETEKVTNTYLGKFENKVLSNASRALLLS